MKIVSWAALALAVLANVGANMAWKGAVQSAPVAGSGLAGALLRSPLFWIGAALAGVLLVSYIIAIRQVPVSIAYIGVTTCAMIGIVVVESAVFGLELTLSNVLGIGLVILGLVLLLRGVPPT